MVENNAFKPGKMSGNVVLNFRGSPQNEFGSYAIAYHRAANVLTKNFCEQKGHNDNAAVPIVFLYRHAIELFLKQLIISVRTVFLMRDEVKKKVEKEEEPQEGAEGELHEIMNDNIAHHKIYDLFELFKKAFKRLDFYPEGGVYKDLDLSDFIEDLCEIDPYSFCFRFPAQKKQGFKFSSLDEQHFTFNLPDFSTKANIFCEALDCADTMLENEKYLYGEMLDM